MKILAFWLVATLVTAQFPRIVWVYWEKGTDVIPIFYQLCLKRMKDVLEQKWDIRLVTDQNIDQWVGTDEAQKVRTFSSLMKLPYKVQYKSDYIRLTLLEKHGGVWMDTGNILVEDMEWLFKLKDNPSVINKIGDAPQVFQFSSGNPFTFPRRWRDGTQYQPSPEGQSWFIAAIPGAQFIKDWRATLASLFFGNRQNYQEYVKRTKVRLGTIPYAGLYLMVYQAEQMVLQVKQQQFDAQGSQKLAVEYYKLWCINSHKGPFLSDPGPQLNREKQNVRIMISFTFDEYVAERSMPRYLIKIYRAQFTQMNYLVSGKDQQFKQHIDKAFTDTSIFGLDRIWPCLNYHILVKGSLIDKYLLASSMELVKGKVYEPEEVPYICRIIDNDYLFIYTSWIVVGTVLAFIFLYGTRNKQLLSTNSLYESIGQKDETVQISYTNVDREWVVAIVMYLAFGGLALSSIIYNMIIFVFPWDNSFLYVIFLAIFSVSHAHRCNKLSSREIVITRLVYSLVPILMVMSEWDCIVNCLRDVPHFYERIAHQFFRIAHHNLKCIAVVTSWIFFIEIIITRHFKMLK